MRKFILFSATAIALFLGGCTEVPTGNRGIEVNFGDVVGSHPEGLTFYNPITTDIVLMNIRQLKWDSTTVAYTKDIQKADIKFALTYSLDANKAEEVYQTVGTEWAALLIPQLVEQTIKDVLGQSEAVMTINNRQAIKDRVTELLTQRLKQKNVNVHGFEFRDIEFSAAFEKAVEAKQVAVENALTSKNKTVQVEEQAKQKIISANADAEAMRIKTQALANNSMLIDYESVMKWDGKLPVHMYGSGAVPFVQVTK